MHQHPRPIPRRTSPALPSQTNASRTNNPREETLAGASPSSRPSTRAGSESDRPQLGSLSDNTRGEGVSVAQTVDSGRLNLIVQHFFTKAALLIISSRTGLPLSFTRDGDVRLDKWFNTWIEDSSVLNDDLEQWRTLNASEHGVPPLNIDVYLDTTHLAQNQSLIVIDDQEQRWDVSEALTQKATSATPTRLIYERWTIGMSEPAQVPSSEAIDAPPNIYKKGVVFLRSVFMFLRLLPAWKFAKRVSRHTGSGPSPRPRYCVTNASAIDLKKDTLDWDLYPSSRPILEEYHFNPLPCVFGRLNISVKYRTNCNFELDSAERLLSQRFAPLSVGGTSSTRTADSTSEELPSDARPKPWTRFSNTSEEQSEGASVKGSRTQQVGSGSGSSLRPEAIVPPRRTSVSFQPFKAGSLSSSPAGALQGSGSPGSSLGRTSESKMTTHVRSRSSLNALPQQALRNPSLPGESAIGSSASSSPKPAPIQRYSSSFGNRRPRFPSSTGSKTEEDNISSRGSMSSLNRGSMNITEEETSGQDDSENIGDFLKMLDRSSRDLNSLSKTDAAAVNANSQRTAAQYSRFSKMRDSTAQLSDSISSSLMLQRSSSSSSRQLVNNPGLVSGASISTSSSPNKPVSPHTPHMPTVPSRLSNNSIAEYSRDPQRTRIRHHSGRLDDREQRSTATGDRGTTAIDIPASPRTFPTPRRSSSVHNQGRVSGHIDDDVLPFGLRSASMPIDDRQTYPVDDDEPLLFAMGELGSQRRVD